MGTAQSKPLSDLIGDWVEYLVDTIAIGANKKLDIHYKQWGGQKCLIMSISKYKSTWSFTKNLFVILVPQGAYKFVAAMDEVIRKLPVAEPTHPVGDNSPLILFTQIVPDDRDYHFELSAWHKKHGEWNFEIRSVPTSEEHKDPEKSLYLPFLALPELRKKMVKMLEEHDGSERIDEMPKIPEWATRAATNIEQQWKQPNVAQEQVTEKKADDAENRPCCSRNVGDPRASK